MRYYRFSESKARSLWCIDWVTGLAWFWSNKKGWVLYCRKLIEDDWYVFMRTTKEIDTKLAMLYQAISWSSADKLEWYLK